VPISSVRDDREFAKFKESTATPGQAAVAIVNPDGTNIGGAGGTSMVDDSAFTPGGSSVTPMGAMLDDTAPDQPDEGDIGVPRLTPLRALHVNLRDQAGAEVSVGGGTQYDEDTLHVTADKVNMAGVVQQTADAALSGDGDRSVLQVDASGWAKVNVKASTGLTDTQLRASAVPVSAASLPLPAGAATEATLATRLTETDFDTKTGSLTEVAPATDTASSGLNGRLQRVAQRLTSLIALLPAALVGGRLDVNLGAAPATVTIANPTVAAFTAGAITEVQGDVAHDAAAAGNPVLVAGIAQDMDDTAPPNRVSAEGDAVRLAADRDGTLFAHPHGPQLWSYHENSSSALTDASVHAAPGAGLSLYVTDIVVSTGAATALNVFLEEGVTTVLGPWYLEAVAGRGLALHFQTPKKITANTALTITTSAAIAHSIDITGFTAQG